MNNKIYVLASYSDDPVAASFDRQTLVDIARDSFHSSGENPDDWETEYKIVLVEIE